ncbi:hypothetical protein CLV36_10713 [Laceyella sediminis]|uniref:Uncharacterized protein n=1 Tax=Laceyella sediminis TaxID=573074 RepID=A0ABX5EMZ8_9BACL|nr:hypothetical protein [Laceyella sediminis]PRZ13823.1 hypothetical protein CLV36_10713 [Laceyella sediminis]
MQMKTKRWAVMGLSATLLLAGAGSVFAFSEQPVQAVHAKKAVHIAKDIHSGDVNKKASQPNDIYDGPQDLIFDGPGAAFLNNPQLFSLLQMDAATLKQALDSGKSVLDVAASKNVSEKQVIDVIVQAQVKVQQQAEKDGKVPPTPIDELIRGIELKVKQVVEHRGAWE